MSDSRLISTGPGWLNRHADTALGLLEHRNAMFPAATANQSLVFMVAPVDIVVTQAAFYPDTAYAAGLTSILRVNDAGTSTLATRAANTATMPALAPINLTIVSGRVSAGDRLILSRGTAGAGTDPASGCLDLKFYMRGTRRDGT